MDINDVETAEDALKALGSVLKRQNVKFNTLRSVVEDAVKDVVSILEAAEWVERVRIVGVRKSSGDADMTVRWSDDADRNYLATIDYGGRNPHYSWRIRDGSTREVHWSTGETKALLLRAVVRFLADNAPANARLKERRKTE